MIIDISRTSDYYFLNNDYECDVWINNEEFKSVSHAYHSCRVHLKESKTIIKNSESIEELYKLSSKIEYSKEFLEKDLNIILEKLIRDKFIRNKDLKEKLILTNESKIEYSLGSEYCLNDKEYLGIYNNNKNKKVGFNYMGILLMQVRDDIKNFTYIEKWVKAQFSVVDNKKLDIDVEVFIYLSTNKKFINSILLSKKEVYVIGNHSKNDIVINNKYISRYHSVLYLDKDSGLCIIDLNSKYKTRINNIELKPFIPYSIKDGSEFKINFSNFENDFFFEINTKKIERKMRKEMEKIEKISENKTILEKYLNENNVSLKEKVKRILKNEIDYEDRISVIIKNIPYSIKAIEIFDFIDSTYGRIMKNKEISRNIQGRDFYIKFENFDGCKNFLYGKTYDDMSFLYMNKKIYFELVEDKVDN